MDMYDQAFEMEERRKKMNREQMERDKEAFVVNVYLDDGRVYKYNVDSADKAREHSDAIINRGYRHNPKGEQVYEAYGPHRVLKVKVTGGKIPTRYPDVEASGT